ncbi:DUF4397 domain-containing protein [Flavitalea sp. BT771]|uniref:DUF4397 domain-containing protein n=1 Tax=Flavitalea sp. BT771 TaxID=3063329 RepID=UPI0026E2889A|nr:DUF4397 domain-containing protein [Flavitalea sp. BT771]MDO6434764.1 DUF4397 domain-containing protein [Flavitalea sp. BT771]MDV6223664.1 DUF4397 domain-containing protein [Flavitalea sp. BT771]
MMNNIFLRQLATCALAGTMLSCAKQHAAPGTASLTLINAVVGSSPSLVTNFSGNSPITWYNKALKLVYGNWNSTYQQGCYSGQQKLAIYHYPDTSAHSTPLFSLDLLLPAGTIHTLFLTGTMSAPDTLFTTDTPPYHPPSDSSVGLRFVNLSPGSNPVSINITGGANGSEVSSLPYKGITGFKNYPATAAVSDYNFEFRDAATGALIGNYDVTGINSLLYGFNNTRLYRNLTLALLGLPGDPASLKIMLIESYTSY